MNYLISKFPLFSIENREIIKKCVAYSFEDKLVLLDDMSNKTLCVTSNFCSNNIVKQTLRGENYFFVFNYPQNDVCVVEIKVLTHSLYVALSNRIKISSGGKMLLDKFVCGIKYDFYEVVDSRCFIYFTGERRFCVCVENEQIKMADYFDEFRKFKNRRYFLKKQFDMLNHGRVWDFDAKCEDYLVYLDDYSLNLQESHVLPTFLDCVMAGNFKYANSLLSEEIRLEKSDMIKNFFPTFDDYYLVDNDALLFFEGKFVGHFFFEIVHSSIVNICEK